MRIEGMPQIVPPEPAAAKGGAGFVERLAGAVEALEAAQQEADAKAAPLAAGGAGNLHELMIALEKADVAMKLAVRVRNKVVEAYQELSRMGV
jgi:flagellar hook-basal body complex protein FliE